MRYIILCVLITLMSCSPQKRLNRLLNKHPDLTKVVLITDTVITPTLYADTVFSFIKDTVFLNHEKLNITYYKVNDSVFLSGTCSSDTIVKERPVIAITPEKSLYYIKFFVVSAVILVTLLAIKIK